MKTVVILQSNYIPWKGYFDLMHDADDFILFDDRQYTRQDWRNRNQVKAEDGQQWLSIPTMIRTHGAFNALGFATCGLLGWCSRTRQSSSA